MTEDTRDAVQLGEEAGGRRREKGLILSEISERTKIRLPFLEAIEEGSLQELPQSIYARGFVKTYLEIIDSLDLWPEYEQVFRSLPGKERLTESLVQYMPPQKGFQKVSKAWMFLFLFFAIGISLYLIWQQKDLISVKPPTLPAKEVISGDVAVSSGETASNMTTDTGVETHPVLDKVTAIVIQDVTQDSVQEDTSWLPGQESKTQSEKPLTAGLLTIRAKGPCWIGVNRQNGGKVQKTLYPGDSFETKIESRTTIRFGSAGAVSLSWDGREVEPIGRMGEVVTFEFLPDGSMKRL